MDAPVTVFWFRRDLRIDDNRGFFEALKKGNPVFPLFIFDTDILENLDKSDARVAFIHKAVTALDHDLQKYGLSLQVEIGKPLQVFDHLLKKHNISSIVANEDYEPYAKARDSAVASLCKKKAVEFFSFKDHVIFARDEVVKDNGQVYKVFTPYSKKWLSQLESTELSSYPSRSYLKNRGGQNLSLKSSAIPSLEKIGFSRSKMAVPELDLKQETLKNYAARRDFLGIEATTKIGVHLRFGTISIRQAVQMAKKLSSIWLKELIWRDFFQMILFHFPHVTNEPFDPKFNKFPWRESSSDFERWKEGETGYPVVDAGMRELNATGYMHNRARMIVGSFLTKHLLLDWRLGERYFAQKLFDFDLASNVGNWQWVAGCGVDAAPYFRVFNPSLQAKKFDGDNSYIQKWVPEWQSKAYSSPIVEHDYARRRALAAYEQIKRF